MSEQGRHYVKEQSLLLAQSLMYDRLSCHTTLKTDYGLHASLYHRRIP